MDLQIFYNNPSRKKRKEKPMRSLRKRKKNPTSAVYRKQGGGSRLMTLEERLAKGLPVGAKKQIPNKGPSIVIGKVKVFTQKETDKAFSTLNKAVNDLSKAKNVQGVEKKLKAAQKVKEHLTKTIRGRIEKLKKEEAKMKDKGYVRSLDMSEAEARREMKKEASDVKRAEKKLKALYKKLNSSAKKVKSVKLPGEKKRKKKAAKVAKKTRKVKSSKKMKTHKRKKSAKKVTPKKSIKRKARKSSSKRRTHKRKGAKASKRRSHKKKSNPIIASNPSVIVGENPKRKKKKASKKKARKSSKRKGSKKKSSNGGDRRKVSKKAAAMMAAEEKPTKKKSKKRKSSKRRKVKASSSHPSVSKKASKKKRSYKSKKHKVKSNPSFGGAMKKIEDFTQDYLGHELAEAGGLLAGGAAIQGIKHAMTKFFPTVKTSVAKIPVLGAFLSKNFDAILPLAIAGAAHHFVGNKRAKAIAKGVIGASVVNLGTSLYLAAAQMAGSQTALSGIIAVPQMSGIIAVPQMGAYHSSDFGAPEGITDADFGGYITTPMSGSYMQDADFDSAGPIPTAPRNPDSLGSAFEVSYDDGEEEADF